MEQLKSVITSFLLLLFLRLRLLDALLSFPDALPLPRPMRRVTSSLANETARSYACTSAVSSQISSSAVVELPSSSNFASTYTNYTAINSIIKMLRTALSCQCVCVFQCQPTVLLCASGSMQGR